MVRERENRHVCGEIHEKKKRFALSFFFILISVNSLTQCVLNGFVLCWAFAYGTVSQSHLLETNSVNRLKTDIK